MLSSLPNSILLRYVFDVFFYVFVLLILMFLLVFSYVLVLSFYCVINLANLSLIIILDT